MVTVGEESLHCLQTSAGQARYRALGSLYPTTGGRLQQDPAEGTAAGFISGRSLQGICSKNLPKTTLQVLCPLDLLSLLLGRPCNRTRRFVRYRSFFIFYFPLCNRLDDDYVVDTFSLLA